MSFNVFATSFFGKELKKLARKYPSIKSDIGELIAHLEESPFAGRPLGKDCYKVRLAISSKNKGKSGGARVITCVKVVQHNIYLLSIFDKSDKETINENDLTILLEAAGLL